MRTNLVLDDDLVQKAIELTGAKSKREVVQLALTELVHRRQHKSLLDLAGKIRFADDFDHKALRAVRGSTR